MTSWDNPEANIKQDLIDAVKVAEAQSWELTPMHVTPDFNPVEYEPYDDVFRLPLVCFNRCEGEGCTPVNPCPFGLQACISDGFCNREYEDYMSRPHVWWGDYA